MDNEEEIFIHALLILMLGIYIVKKQISFRWVNRQYWVRPINVRRPDQGDFNHLLQEMKNDPFMFFRYTRMSLCIFNQLLEMMTPFLVKKSHRALIPEQRLALTLRFLDTGDQVLSIALAYRIGESTARKVIKETCAAIIRVLAPLYLPSPTEEDWIKVCEGFWTTWNLPNCCGAVDGKHVQIQAPPNSGSLYFNYKKTFSIILMAACDHNYKFTVVDVGAYGSNSDGGVLSRSEFGKALHNGNLNLPKGEANLPGSRTRTPCFFVGDEAFQLTQNMMRPYPGRNLNVKKKIFNYRLSRARRVIENTFGILVSRWRILRKSITLHPENVDKIILATICLHNFLKTVNDLRPAEHRIYCPPNFVDTEQEDGTIISGGWRSECSTSNVVEIERIRATNARRSTTLAYKQRDEIADYLLTPEGEVSWQYEYINRGFNSPDFH
ncbi:uncharacterized protein [Temnothorax longispinosus]|uniref:uncharacterized protein n=1 Tax=Temnothorax longispinosus TaxID=300112 RepID=UPI003A9A52B1